MKIFYSFLLAWTELDLIIARSTGRNFLHIAQLQKEIAEYQLRLFQLQLEEDELRRQVRVE